MLFREIIAAYREKHKKHTKAVGGQNAAYIIVQESGKYVYITPTLL
jgi:hypothetical protein